MDSKTFLGMKVFHNIDYSLLVSKHTVYTTVHKGHCVWQNTYYYNNNNNVQNDYYYLNNSQ